MRTANRTALKEWALVVDALKEGRQIFLLRKGGIAEAEGQFKVGEREFSLYPTFLHQEKQYIRPEFHAAFDRILKEGETFGRVRIDSYAVVEEVLQVTDLAPLHKLEPYHIWTPAYIDLRYQYKPESPLYLLLLRVHRLPRPVEFEETKAYRGCKSWVTLDFEITPAGVTPVLSDGEFQERARAIRETLQA
ncbi:MAG: DUF1802 family protein [Candidatus Methylomirabilales bacterium]